MLEAANSSLAMVPPEERPVWPEDESLRKIALAGKQWKRTIGRTLDMEGSFLFLSLAGTGRLIWGLCSICVSIVLGMGAAVGRRPRFDELRIFWSWPIDSLAIVPV